jgi:hypothetical protein
VKVGAESRTKVIAVVSLGILLLIVIVTQFGGLFGGMSSTAASPTASRPGDPNMDVSPAPRSSARTRVAGKKETIARSMDPSLRLDLLKESEDTKYEGTGRNIFRTFVEPPPRIVKNPVLDHQSVAQGPPPPAPPPPINPTFYGFATPTGGTKRIFLAKGEDVFIAKEGDIVDRRYKVVRISQNSVEILDVLSNNRQSIPLTQG